MAKRVSRMLIQVEVDPVAGTQSVSRCYYDIGDSEAEGAVYQNIAGPNPCPLMTITPSDLAGSLSAFLDKIKTNIESQEGLGT